MSATSVNHSDDYHLCEDSEWAAVAFNTLAALVVGTGLALKTR